MLVSTSWQVYGTAHLTTNKLTRHKAGRMNAGCCKQATALAPSWPTHMRFIYIYEEQSATHRTFKAMLLLVDCDLQTICLQHDASGCSHTARARPAPENSCNAAGQPSASAVSGVAIRLITVPALQAAYTCDSADPRWVAGTHLHAGKFHVCVLVRLQATIFFHPSTAAPCSPKV